MRAIFSSWQEVYTTRQKFRIAAYFVETRVPRIYGKSAYCCIAVENLFWDKFVETKDIAVDIRVSNIASARFIIDTDSIKILVF